MTTQSSLVGSRSLAVLGAFLTIIASGIVSYYVSSQTAKIQYANDVQLRMLDRADTLRTAAQDFSAFVGSYVANMSEGTSAEVARKDLSENIQRQYATIELIHIDGISSAQQYKDALSSLAKTINPAPSVNEMRPFWEASVEVLKARDNYFRELDQELLDSI